MNPRIAAMSPTLLQALGETEQEALIDLWDLDLRRLGGEIHYLCRHINEKNEAVVWQGRQYEPWPIEATGFEATSKGPRPRPSISVSNIMGFVTGVVNQYDGLNGATVVRRQVYARFLDAVNFAAGNPQADPVQEVVTQFVIERMVSLSPAVAVFELALPSAADGALAPCRMMMAGTCCWRYRSEECGYSGPPVADRYGMPTNDASKDACGGGLLDCQARFGATAVLPIGIFPAIGRVGQ